MWLVYVKNVVSTCKNMVSICKNIVSMHNILAKLVIKQLVY